MNDTKHHVAWADRIGLNKQWSRDIQNCGDCFGSGLYVDAVRRFRRNIINIKSGPCLKDIIDNHISSSIDVGKKKLLDEWKRNYPQHADNESYVLQKEDEIDRWAAEELFVFMLQLLEDEGFCFYESNVEEDEISLTK